MIANCQNERSPALLLNIKKNIKMERRVKMKRQVHIQIPAAALPLAARHFQDQIQITQRIENYRGFKANKYEK